MCVCIRYNPNKSRGSLQSRNCWIFYTLDSKTLRSFTILRIMIVLEIPQTFNIFFSFSGYYKFLLPLHSLYHLFRVIYLIYRHISYIFDTVNYHLDNLVTYNFKSKRKVRAIYQWKPWNSQRISNTGCRNESACALDQFPGARIVQRVPWRLYCHHKSNKAVEH